MDAAPPTDDNLLLLSLGLSDDSEPEEAADPTAANNNNNAPPPPPADSSTTRADRTALSEDAYQALKQSYRPKLENGNIYSTITLPGSRPLAKPEAQELLHAVEELYFFRRYVEAVAFVDRVLSTSVSVSASDGADGAHRGGGGGGGEKEMLDGETRRLLGYYRGRCLARLGEEQKG